MSNQLIKMLLNKNVENDFKKSLTEIYNGNYRSASSSLDEVIERDIEDVPISPEMSTWKVIEDDKGTKSLKKTYRMNDARHVLYFVNELIRRSEYINHHPMILIDHHSVAVQLTTKDLGDVTELDKELSEYCDELYSDVVHINS